MDKYDSIKLENQLCFPLYAASREVIKLYKPVLDKYNLTYTQYIVMLAMWEYEKLTVKQLGQKLYLDSGTVTPVLKKLESMELIRKYRDKDDDRVVIVELTDKAELMKDEILDVPNLVLCQVNLSKVEYLILKNALELLLNKLP